jgi:hypothetical protein
MVLYRRALIASLVLAGLCGTVCGQTKAVSAVSNGSTQLFDTLFSNSPVSVSFLLAGMNTNQPEQFGIYTQSGGLFEKLAPTGIVISSGKVVDVKTGATPSSAFNRSSNIFEAEKLVPGQKIADHAKFDMAFSVTQNTSISFSFVFASKEYNTGNSDVFGFWVNDVNLALIGGNPVTTANVNCGASGVDRTRPNCDQYINNAAQSGTSLTGYTKTQIMVANLKQGRNTIKIIVADSYRANGPVNTENDSVVFLSITPGSTRNPTKRPTVTPTKRPTMGPTKRPTMIPTMHPTMGPTKSPTMSPTQRPTMSPTKLPTKNPTNTPTSSPSFGPTVSPSKFPTKSPSMPPTDSPTRNRTNSPTMRPTPIAVPSPVAPPTSPTSAPSTFPSRFPSDSRSEKSPTKPVRRPSGKGKNGTGKSGKGRN